MNVPDVNLQAALQPLGAGLIKNSGAAQEASGATRPFDDFFQAYLNLVSETNIYQAENDQLVMDYAAGKTDDIAAVTLAGQKAYTTLNFTIQVTNKVVEAYREIMRITL